MKKISETLFVSLTKKDLPKKQIDLLRELAENLYKQSISTDQKDIEQINIKINEIEAQLSPKIKKYIENRAQELVSWFCPKH